MTDSLLEAGLAHCLAHGFRVSEPDDAGEPPGIARPPTDGSSSVTEPPAGGSESATATASDAGGSQQRTERATGEQVPDEHGEPAGPTTGDDPTHVGGLPPSELFGTGERVAVEPIREPDPTTVLSRLWNDRNHDRLALFVAPDRERAQAIDRLLSPPVGVQAADEEGRVFYSGPDRVPLAEGEYAAAPAGAELLWRESAVSEPPSGIVSSTDDRAERSRQPTGDRTPGDQAGDSNDEVNETSDDEVNETNEETWLTLLADGEPIVHLSGVDALAYPDREQFPYGYRRDRDKQIRVVDFAGRPVDRYPGIGAMREGGFQPVPAPLVPEHMFDEPITDRWSVVVASDS